MDRSLFASDTSARPWVTAWAPHPGEEDRAGATRRLLDGMQAAVLRTEQVTGRAYGALNQTSEVVRQLLGLVETWTDRDLALALDHPVIGSYGPLPTSLTVAIQRALQRLAALDDGVWTPLTLHAASLSHFRSALPLERYDARARRWGRGASARAATEVPAVLDLLEQGHQDAAGGLITALPARAWSAEHLTRALRSLREQARAAGQVLGVWASRSGWTAEQRRILVAEATDAWAAQDSQWYQMRPLLSRALRDPGWRSGPALPDALRAALGSERDGRPHRLATSAAGLLREQRGVDAAWWGEALDAAMRHAALVYDLSASPEFPVSLARRALDRHPTLVLRQQLARHPALRQDPELRAALVAGGRSTAVWSALLDSSTDPAEAAVLVSHLARTRPQLAVARLGRLPAGTRVPRTVLAALLGQAQARADRVRVLHALGGGLPTSDVEPPPVPERSRGGRGPHAPRS